MSAFQKGDLVVVIETASKHYGSVAVIDSRCVCFSAFAISLHGLETYSLGALGCFIHTSLKKIEGERQKEIVEETRDEPVAA